MSVITIPPLPPFALASIPPPRAHEGSSPASPFLPTRDKHRERPPEPSHRLTSHSRAHSDGPPYGQSTVHTSADMIMRGTPKMQPATFLAQSYPSTFLPPWRGPINGAGSVVGADIEVSQINKSTHYIPRSSPHTHTSHTHASAARKSLDEVVDHVRSLNQVTRARPVRRWSA